MNQMPSIPAMQEEKMGLEKHITDEINAFLYKYGCRDVSVHTAIFPTVVGQPYAAEVKIDVLF